MLKNNQKKPLYSYLIAKYFIVLFLLIILIVWGVGYLLLLGPKYSKIKSAGNLKEKEAQLKVQEDYLTRLETLLANFHKITPEERAKIYQVLPRGQDIPEFVLQLEGLREKNALVLLSLEINDTQKSVRPASPQKVISTLGISNQTVVESDIKLGQLNVMLKVSGGNYYAFLKLLEALENNIRLIDIETFDFQELGESWTIKFKTYYLSEEPEELKEL